MASSQQVDVNMAKLQKRTIRGQRQSLPARAVATKLTPAEIRSLNNSVVSFKNGDKLFYQATTPMQSRRLSSNTPPLTPEYAMANRKQLSQRPGVNLPTPPHSPDHMYQQRRNSNPINGYAHIHAPKPRAYTTAHFVNRAPISRPSSASSYRGVTTYRDPEIIRSGSLTMLHQPPPDIVSNPLSQFSRPRRSQTVASIDRNGSRHSAVESPLQMTTDEKERLEKNNSRPSSRTTSPPQKSNSFVSDRDMKSPSAGSDTGRDGTNGIAMQEDPQLEKSNSVTRNGDRSVDTQPHVSNWSWRRSMSQQRAEEKDEAALKKIRRHTMSFSMRSNSTHSIAYSDTKAGAAPILRDTLKGELPSEKALMSKDQSAEITQAQRSSMFGPHPSVRPLSLQIPMQQSSSPVEISPDQPPLSIDMKGKGKEVDTAPVYGRCSCCGKLKKPNAFHSELSPVIENENLRTNFSLEADRTSIIGKKRSSSLVSTNRQKYTPIIPMPVGADKTVQASIEPFQNVRTNERNDTIASSSGYYGSGAMRETDPSLVRFSSLRTKGGKGSNSQENDMGSTSIPEKANRSVVSSATGSLHSAVENQTNPEVINSDPSTAPTITGGRQAMEGDHVKQVVSPSSVQPEAAGSESPQELRGRLVQRSKAEEVLIQSKPKPNVTDSITAERQSTQPPTQLEPKEDLNKSEMNSEPGKNFVTIPNVEQSPKPSNDQESVQKQEKPSPNKSQYRASGLSMFRRHRKSRSLPQNTTSSSSHDPMSEAPADATPVTAPTPAAKTAVVTSVQSTPTPLTVVDSSEAVTPPEAPTTNHHLVTVPPETVRGETPATSAEHEKTENPVKDDESSWLNLLSGNVDSTLANTSEPQLQALGQMRSPPSTRLQAHLRQQLATNFKPHGASRLSRTVKFSQESIKEESNPQEEVEVVAQQLVPQSETQPQEQIQPIIPTVPRSDLEATPQMASNQASQTPADAKEEDSLLSRSLNPLKHDTGALTSTVPPLAVQPGIPPEFDLQPLSNEESHVTVESPIQSEMVQSEESAMMDAPEYPQTALNLLPVPQLGPHFTRSSSTLRNYVISREQSSNHLIGTVLAASGNTDIPGYDHDLVSRAPSRSLISGVYETRESYTAAAASRVPAASTLTGVEMEKEYEQNKVYLSKGRRDISPTPSERLRQELRRNEKLSEERIAREKLFAEVMAI